MSGHIWGYLGCSISEHLRVLGREKKGYLLRMYCKCIWCTLGILKRYLKYLGGIYGCLGISVAFKGYLGMSEGSWEQL